MLVLVGFQLNRIYIIQNLCENRFVPEKKCQGSCHLKKELDKQQKNQSSSESRLQEVMEVNYVLQDNHPLAPRPETLIDMLFPLVESPQPEDIYLPVWVPPPSV
jgi:hypothetical protein